MKFKNVQDVVEWRLCVGCGACAYACSEKAISLVDIVTDGIRPLIKGEICKSCGECLKICPGYGVIHDYQEEQVSILENLRVGWGPVLEVWEGHANDADLRYRGSSGGAASALALCCLEKLGFGSVVHTGSDREKPWKNATTISHNREDLLSATGSRYSPASPCEGLGYAEASYQSSVFIGKPCDIQGLRKTQGGDPRLDGKVIVAIGIFCAGTPSTQGTIDLLKQAGISKEQVGEIRYRGNGWPGRWEVQLIGNDSARPSLSYMEAWGFLQKYRPYRCHLCPDGTSEFADISCGDPWYRDLDKGDPGYSLVLVRTEVGKKIVSQAIQAGYVTLKPANPEILAKSQKNLLEKRKAIWGRLLAMKLFGIPTPSLKGFHLFSNWCRLSIKGMSRSLLGTARRIVKRKYFKPEKLFSYGIRSRTG